LHRIRSFHPKTPTQEPFFFIKTKSIKVGRNIHFLQKGVGDPNPFTVSQMSFFRSTISKKIVFFAFFYRILVKGIDFLSQCAININFPMTPEMYRRREAELALLKKEGTGKKCARCSL
jgi:hypothetical protein